ncbi:MAG: hypothetical protein ABL974_23130, partial [Prosthecobacter sp.]
MKLPSALFALSLLGCALAVDMPTPSPTNFGIKDGSVPEDPREVGGRGQFLDFPTWPVSKELPNDLFTFCRLRYNSQDWGRGRRGGGKWTTD